MNLSYFRASHRSYTETLETLKNALKEKQWNILGEAKLSDEQGLMIFIYKQEWLDKLFHIDYHLLGLMPFSVSIINKENKVLVGSGQTQIIKALGTGQELNEMASKTEAELKKLIHEAANVGEPKLEKVKLYSSKTCPYCKMEQKWLEDHKIEHSVVYVDLQQEEAENLVKRTGQLGVPVTEITFEESEPEFVIGFDRNRLSDLFNLNQQTLMQHV